MPVLPPGGPASGARLGRRAGLVAHTLAEPFAEALRGLQRARRPRLGVKEAPLPNALWLKADLAGAVAAAPLPEAAEHPTVAGGEPASAGCGQFRRRLFIALTAQHPGLVEGIHGLPATAHGWCRSEGCSVLLVPGVAEESQALLMEAIENQSLPVDLDDCHFRVPVAAVVGAMPADHVRVVIKGLPCDYARQGLLEALLGAAGYAPGDGCVVVSERGGLVTLEGVTLSVPDLGVVVGVVKTPAGDPRLCRLPEAIAVDDWQAVLSVFGVTHNPAPPPAPHRPRLQHRPQPVPRRHRAPAALDRVYAAHGLTPAAVAAGSPPVAVAAQRASRLPGDRGGLGAFPGPAMQTSPPVWVPAQGSLPVQQSSAAAASPPSADVSMLDAPVGTPPPPLADSPMPDAARPPALPGDPLVAVACGWIQDETALTAAQARDVVHSMVSCQPAVFERHAGTTMAGDLTREIRQILHDQGGALYGSEAVAALAPCLPASLSVDEASVGAAAEGTAVATAGPVAPGLRPPPGLRAGAAHRGRGQDGGSQSGTPPRRSSREHHPPKAFWQLPPTPPHPADSPRQRDRGGGAP